MLGNDNRLSWKMREYESRHAHGVQAILEQYHVDVANLVAESTDRTKAGDREWDPKVAFGEVEGTHGYGPIAALAVWWRRGGIARQPDDILPKPHQLSSKTSRDKFEAATMALEIMADHQ